MKLCTLHMMYLEGHITPVELLKCVTLITVKLTETQIEGHSTNNCSVIFKNAGVMKDKSRGTTLD